MRLKTLGMRSQVTLDWVALPLSATGGQSIHFLLPFCALAHEDIEKKMFTPETGPGFGLLYPRIMGNRYLFFFQKYSVCGSLL